MNNIKLISERSSAPKHFRNGPHAILSHWAVVARMKAPPIVPPLKRFAVALLFARETTTRFTYTQTLHEIIASSREAACEIAIEEGRKLKRGMKNTGAIAIEIS